MSSLMGKANDRIYAIIGSRIQGHRVRLGMTQKEFCDYLLPQVKMHRTSMTCLELGKQRIMLHDLVGIADKVGVDLLEFFQL